jgi:tetratricopeptide (TPR) repeat protein
MLGVFVAATNQTPQTPVLVASNAVQQTTGITLPVADPLENDYQNLLAQDDAAQAEVDKWIRDNQAFLATGGGVPDAELNRRLEERLKPVRQAYENFIAAHPDHARARVAYGSFLNDTREEDAAVEQWEKARALDPQNSAVWNNLANYYGEHGPITNAFAFYTKAIELNPLQSVYYHNFGTTVYLFRKDAMEFFKITEPQVFDKAFNLYSNALKLDPENFPLASDIAQTYYGIKPLRIADALHAWTNAFALARDEIEREGVQLHFARVKLAAGLCGEARTHLDAVTNAMYADLKKRLARNLAAQENPAAITNAEPPVAGVKSWNTNELPKEIYRLGR